MTILTEFQILAEASFSLPTSFDSKASTVSPSLCSARSRSSDRAGTIGPAVVRRSDGSLERRYSRRDYLRWDALQLKPKTARTYYSPVPPIIALISLSKRSCRETKRDATDEVRFLMNNTSQLTVPEYPSQLTAWTSIQVTRRRPRQVIEVVQHRES